MPTKHQCGKLHVIPFALAAGTVWGIAVLSLAWLAAISDWAHPIVQIFGSVYRGASATFAGGLIGLLWGFVDGFIGGLFFAFIYNFACSRCKKCKFCKSLDG